VHGTPLTESVTPSIILRASELPNFIEVVAGPMVRLSYRAERTLDLNNAGL
jgi:hypothetical protein